MANQAYLDAINGTSVSKQGLIDQIKQSIDSQNYYSSQNTGAGNSDLRNAATREYHKQAQLKDLLALLNQSGGSGWSAGGSVGNPFGTGSGGAGVPKVSTDNRFAAGLSDAEARLRSLLDDPDSIKQSAAYKFRVKQGEDALQRNLGARGLLNSGNRLMELTKYGQDMGSQEYDAQYGRLGNLLGNYSQGYTADKNANTAQFSAQANAWNTAQGNQDANTRQQNDIWNQRTPVSLGVNSGFRWLG